jgi:Zn-dependent alcohol dehydrogenase
VPKSSASVLFASLLLVGCAFSSGFERAPGAPELAPSASVAVVGEAPPGAVLLGTVTVQGNNHQGGAGCEQEAQFEAKKVGATHVVIRPAKPGIGKGPKCTGEAYYLAAHP